MDSRYAWLVGSCSGILVGYVFGFSRGDIWAGVVLVLTVTVAGYGFFAFPEYRTRWSGQSSPFWYTASGVLGVIAIIGIPNSPHISYSIQLSVLIAALWVAGVFTGVALERDSASNTETNPDHSKYGDDSNEDEIDHY